MTNLEKQLAASIVLVKKRKKPAALKAKSMNLLREQGYLVADVEYRLPFSPGKRLFGERKDLFGFGDLLGIRPDTRKIDRYFDKGMIHLVPLGHLAENLIVQVCRKQDMKERIRKIRSLDAHKVWLSIPCNRIVVHGWHQKKARSLWQCEVESVTL
jgi:hypothetical protein